MAVQIRLAQDSDAEAIAAIYRPAVEATSISFETVPPDRHEMARRIHETLRSYPWLVCDRGEQVAGYAYATRHRERAAYRWSVDTSIFIGAKHHRMGIGRGLYLSLFAILAAQGYFNAYAGITLPNAASVGLHESMGFQKVGMYCRVGHKFGQWHDVGWWQLTLKEYEASPAEPLDLVTVQGHADWDVLLGRGESVVRG